MAACLWSLFLSLGALEGVIRLTESMTRCDAELSTAVCVQTFAFTRLVRPNIRVYSQARASCQTSARSIG